MSELLPDGQNRYLDDDTGYTERDQRITETIVSSTGNEDYISYVPSENLNLNSRRTVGRPIQVDRCTIS